MRRLKKILPPVLDDKKKKNKKSKRATRMTIPKENREPPNKKEKFKTYESLNSCTKLNMSPEEIYLNLLNLKMTSEELRMNKFPSQSCPSPNLVPAGNGVRLCARCGSQFEVIKGEYVSSTVCSYHPRKPVFQTGAMMRLYPCCEKNLGAPGCTNHNYHVTIQHGPKTLMKTSAKRHIKRDLQQRVFSLDCEMSFTTEGMEVTRIALLNLDGLSVYESYVKPKNLILDYNTLYSGVAKHHLDNVNITIDDVKKILSNIIHGDTILVGHALNNDLAALGLIHETVVDTSVLYPNHKIPRNKRSLKSLVSEFLHSVIQEDPSGHDCIEDARACLQLALLKIPPNPPSVSRETYPLVPMENRSDQTPYNKYKETSSEQRVRGLFEELRKLFPHGDFTFADESDVQKNRSDFDRLMKRFYDEDSVTAQFLQNQINIQRSRNNRYPCKQNYLEPAKINSRKPYYCVDGVLYACNYNSFIQPPFQHLY